MLRGRIVSLLCASFAFAAPAAAQRVEPTPFVAQVRVPARNATLDVFAWRNDDGVMLDRSTLETLGLVVPASIDDDPVPLSTIPGLTYEEDAGSAAIVVTCDASCYRAQVLAANDNEHRPNVTRATGGYLNYDLNAQWLDGEETVFGGVAEGAVFGAFGLIESSWLGQSGAEPSFARLETRWTMDFPDQRLRLRIGDSAMVGASSAPFRFAGVQLGRHFALAPSMITYPTPTLSGEAQSASTVELYVDGALRARERVNAGPFVFDNAPLVSGGGQAELVVTDILGRSEIISRPFFVSTSMLRPGLSDWSIAAGTERERYASEQDEYGQYFASGRYRRGITNALTAEGAFELTESGNAFELGAAFADYRIGQVRVARAESENGAQTEASWYRDSRAWSFGLQWQERDPTFRALGDSESNVSESAAANFGLELGNAGSASITAAEVRFFDDKPARTLTLAYTPEIGDEALSFRLLYTEQEEQTWSFGVSWSVALRGDVSSQVGAEIEDSGSTLHASAQRPVDSNGGLGWRVRAAAGDEARADAAITYAGPLGESMLQAASTRYANGVRAGHTGSIGWVANQSFAARRIDGAFALVDAGEANVGVARDHLNIGATNRNGRLLAVNLRPYDVNTIAIAADDLPLDRAPTTTEATVTPGEGAGVVIRFPQATARLVESRVQWRDGGSQLRGAVLVRQRDGARFPIGSEGRIVVIGAVNGDVMRLDADARCTAPADSRSLEQGLMLSCDAS